MHTRSGAGDPILAIAGKRQMRNVQIQFGSTASQSYLGAAPDRQSKPASNGTPAGFASDSVSQI